MSDLFKTEYRANAAWLRTPDHNFADNLIDEVACEQTLKRMLRNPNVSHSDRLVMWLRLRGYSSMEVAKVLRIEESAICNRLAKLWKLYEEYAVDNTLCPECGGFVPPKEPCETCGHTQLEET